MHSLLGTWENEFNSRMVITEVKPDGTFRGTYSSTTGASGTYTVVGVFDTHPTTDPPTAGVGSMTLSFSISWRSVDGGAPNETWHWCSGFAGQLQEVAGAPQIATTYLLVKDTKPADNWGATVVATATFHKVGDDANPSAERWLSGQGDAKLVFSLQREALSDNGATPWFTPLELGTPGQTLKLTLDTGTENSWVTSAACTTEACEAHDRFNPQASSTFKMLNSQRQKVSFGPWGDMFVELGSDQLTLPTADGGQLQQRMKLQLAVEYSGSKFADLTWDGGLAVPSLQVKGKDEPTELLQRLWHKGLIDQPVISFRYDAQAGTATCAIGGLDSELRGSGRLNVLPLSPEPGSLHYLWTVALDAFVCGGEALPNPPARLCLDSGSSWFKGSEAVIKPLVAAATRGGTLPTTLTDPQRLSEYPDIAVVLNGVSYPLTPAQYFLYLPAQRAWVLGLHVLDGLPDDLLLVGSMFMETVYTAFFFDPKSQTDCAVAIAKLP